MFFDYLQGRDLMFLHLFIVDVFCFSVDDDTEDITEMSEDKPENDQPEIALWVEKFTPKRFTELLNDDVRLLISFCYK